MAYEAGPVACRIYRSSDVSTCRNDLENPHDSAHFPALREFPLRAGRMLNEGVCKYLNVKNVIPFEWTLESSLKIVLENNQVFGKWTDGVYVLPASGSPGSGIKVRIRGAGSNGNSQPLFIVDGIKTNDVLNIELSDIERMEVLKDAASSAIYGAEGANSVVIITTKTGTAGTSGVDYSFQYGIQSAGNLPTLMNADQYIDFMNDGIIPSVTSSGYNTNWLDEIFENAPMQKHHLSFTGSKEMTTFVTSLSYYDQDGILGGDKANYKGLSGRLMLTIKKTTG